MSARSAPDRDLAPKRWCRPGDASQPITAFACPDCGMVHDYNCRRYFVTSIVLALWVAASLLILVDALPKVLR
jgi:hypothetical protein